MGMLLVTQAVFMPLNHRQEPRMLKILGIAAATTAICASGAASTSSAQPMPTTKPTTASAPVGVSEHDNTVTIAAVNPVSDNNVSFEWDGGYSITGGQPWGGVSTSQSGGPIVINVQAGRSGTSGPADWFNARTSMPIGNDVTIGGQPSELNFAFSGTLTVNGASYPVVFGQGHDSEGQNNWWLGGQGSGWTEFTVSPEALRTPDGQYAIATSDNDADDDFEVQTAN